MSAGPVYGGVAQRSTGALRSSAGGAPSTDSDLSSSPLVTNTSIAHPPDAPSSPVSVGITNKNDDFAVSRLARYLLQRTAAKYVPLRDDGTRHRVSGCLWWLAAGAMDVGVVYSPSAERARYRRLQTCGSVWACPVCAERVTERRAAEIRAALAALVGKGGSAAFATFTVSHDYNDSLATLLPRFLVALRKLSSKPSYQRLCKRNGYRGYIRVLETTHGRNGFHPHAHAIYCFDRLLSAAEISQFEEDMFPLWSAAAAVSGFTMSRKYGLQIIPVYGTVEEYLAKWGRLPRWSVAREIAKGHTKHGRSIAGMKSLTPWELLAAAHDGDQRCGALFGEYVGCFEGRNQLVWSPGLWEWLGLPMEYKGVVDAAGNPHVIARRLQLTDAECAVSAESDTEEKGAIPREWWESVKRAGGRTRPLEILEASGGDWGPVADYLLSVITAYPPALPVSFSSAPLLAGGVSV